MSDRETINVDDAYALETPDDNVQLYKQWAATYDTEFAEHSGYIVPEQVAAIMLRQQPRIDEVILDAGCGTGLVGQALRAGGIALVDGIDISPEMLVVAGTKTTDDGGPVYRELIQADLTQPLDIPDDHYGAVISAGTFTHGHLGPEPLDELWRIAAPGAPCVIGIRTTHYEAMGFADKLAADVAGGVITEPQQVLARQYAEDTGNEAHGDDMAFIVVCEVR